MLSIADDVAGWVAGDRLASPSEREAAPAHGAYLRQRMRRIQDSLHKREPGGHNVKIRDHPACLCGQFDPVGITYAESRQGTELRRVSNER